MFCVNLGQPLKSGNEYEFHSVINGECHYEVTEFVHIRPLLQIVGTIVKTKFGRCDVTSNGIYVQCTYRWSLCVKDCL